MLAQSLDRLLANRCPPGQLRKFYERAELSSLWSELASLGYHDALIPENLGGAGLGLVDVCDLFMTLGHRLCPLSLGETMVARAILAQARIELPEGPILLVTPHVGSDDTISANATPLGLRAAHALLDLKDRQLLVSLESATIEALNPGLSLSANIVWHGLPADAIVLDPPAAALRPTAAAIRAAAIAGMITGVLELSLAYTSTRQQFGRALCEFQAVQQQLAVLAEEAAASTMAAAIGCTAKGPLAAPMDAAVAKMRTSESACRSAAIAHAVHGAIGMSKEYDLQLYTRRLAEERIADGGEHYWAEQIGRSRLADNETSSAVFVRTASGDCREGEGLT
jgi:acyl-CoA dehydrogenase